jgi:protoporphyrinogen oxidase
MLSLPPAFSFGIAQDMLGKLVPASRNGASETFASMLRSSLGKTICRDFYFPYAEKIWGLPPEELSVIQARRRVSAGSLGKMARKAVALLPGLKSPGAGRFFYPRGGFGQISRVIAGAARDLGVDIRLQTIVRKLSLGTPHRLEIESKDGLSTIEADCVWSTIPITVLARITDPCAPARVLEASRGIEYRAMILVYLVLGQEQFTPFDAHYFPEPDIKLTRLSEPKNYSGTREPLDRTILCGELPCMVGDDVWRLSDDDLGELVKESLARCGLPVKAPVIRVATRRLPFAYPIYRNGYEQAFNTLDDWAASLDRVLTFGRQGLFAHDNTHHALAMAYAAVDCLQESGEFDMTMWKDYRAEFAKHVVED